MAVAPAPVADPKAGDPPADPPDPPAATESTVDQIVEKVLAKLDVLKTEEKPAGEPAKRKTYRDEEETMGELVTVKVKDLPPQERAGGENPPDPKTEKAGPDPPPAMPAGRRVE